MKIFNYFLLISKNMIEVIAYTAASIMITFYLSLSIFKYPIHFWDRMSYDLIKSFILLVFVFISFIPVYNSLKYSNKKKIFFLQIAWLIFLLFVLANQIFGFIHFVGYGDEGDLSFFITAKAIFPRWAAGSAMLNWIYGNLQQLLPKRITPDVFVRISGALVMIISTLVMLWRWPVRFALLIPILTPIWLLFSSGYNEYYPFIASLFLTTLAWIFLEAPDKQHPYIVGLFAGSLPLFYVGFAPLSVMILIYYVFARPESAFEAVEFAAFFFFVLLSLIWKQGLISFTQNLYFSMNFGEQNNFPRYAGKVASETSVFFNLSYALSTDHLSEVGYMGFFGLGWVVPLLIIASFSFLAYLSRKDYQIIVRKPKFWLGISLFVWFCYYFLFMLPRLGPTRDIDLFFNTYIVLAFLAGLLLDLILQRVDLNERIKSLILATLIGNTALISLFLLVIKIPDR